MQLGAEQNLSLVMTIVTASDGPEISRSTNACMSERAKPKTWSTKYIVNIVMSGTGLYQAPDQWVVD